MIRVSTAAEIKRELLQFIDDKISEYNMILTKEPYKKNADFRMCYEIKIKITELISVKNFITHGFVINDYCRNDVKDLITKLNTFIEQTEISEENNNEQ